MRDVKQTILQHPARLLLIALMCGFLAGGEARGLEVIIQGGFHVDENQFDLMVLGSENVSAARKRMERQMQLQVDAIDRVCRLTDSQTKKLELAGRGDIIRFLKRVDEGREKFLAVRKDRQKFNQVWQDLQPLQREVQEGIFHEKSMLNKVLDRTLNPEQFERYKAAQAERRRFQYKARVGVVLSMIERGIPLREKQRTKFVELLLSETEPPLKFGQLDYQVVLCLAARIPEEKLEAIFDDVQWQALSKQLAQAKQMERHLTNEGYLLPQTLEMPKT